MPSKCQQNWVNTSSHLERLGIKLSKNLLVEKHQYSSAECLKVEMDILRYFKQTFKPVQERMGRFHISRWKRRMSKKFYLCRCSLGECLFTFFLYFSLFGFPKVRRIQCEIKRKIVSKLNKTRKSRLNWTRTYYRILYLLFYIRV